ncbi:MAG: hypothetical protein LBD56_00520, partial [Endomicrobium sp.]|nr:hypothetical protein [Endomicrobium sp.]
PGDKEIPAASLSFLNPTKKQYKTVKTQSQIIVVRGETVYAFGSSEKTKLLLLLQKFKNF